MVSSVPGAIRDYFGLNTVNIEAVNDYISRRHFIYPYSTAIDGIKEVKPGESIEFSINESIKLHRSNQRFAFNLIHDPSYSDLLSEMTYDDYIVHFKEIFSHTCKMLSESAPNNSTALVASGGIDSTVVSRTCSSFLDSYHTFCLDFGGKENPISLLQDILPMSCHFTNIVHRDQYYESMCRCYELLAGPLPTHSFASSWLLGRDVSEHSYRVLIGGEGADEAFMGYSTYLDQTRYSADQLLSIYAGRDRNLSQLNEFDSLLSDTSLSILEAIQINSEFDISFFQKVASIIDTCFQLPSVGYLSADLALSDHGIEGRTPFSRWHLLKLAINTPIKHLLDMSRNSTKLPLNSLFEELFSISPPPKSGFAGFPNETISYLGDSSQWLIGDVLGVSMNDEFSRAKAWKYINTEFFLRTL